MDNSVHRQALTHFLAAVRARGREFDTLVMQAPVADRYEIAHDANRRGRFNGYPVVVTEYAEPDTVFLLDTKALDAAEATLSHYRPEIVGC